MMRWSETALISSNAAFRAAAGRFFCLSRGARRVCRPWSSHSTRKATRQDVSVSVRMRLGIRSCQPGCRSNGGDALKALLAAITNVLSRDQGPIGVLRFYHVHVFRSEREHRIELPMGVAERPAFRSCDHRGGVSESNVNTQISRRSSACLFGGSPRPGRTATRADAGGVA